MQIRRCRQGQQLSPPPGEERAIEQQMELFFEQCGATADEMKGQIRCNPK
jgi:hypothetical protein